MSDIEIRAARHDDAHAVIDLWRASESPPSVTDDTRAVLGLLERHGEALLVAVRDGEIVGSLIAGWDGWRGNMYRIAVHPDHRRRGIARKLIDEGEGRLRALGCRRITALVLGDETDAVGFWRAVGYTRQVEIARFYRNLD